MRRVLVMLRVCGRRRHVPPSVTLSLLDHYVNHLHLFAYESIFYVCGSLPRTFTLFSF